MKILDRRPIEVPAGRVCRLLVNAIPLSETAPGLHGPVCCLMIAVNVLLKDQVLPGAEHPDVLAERVSEWSSFDK